MIFKGYIIPILDPEKGLIYTEYLSEDYTKELAEKFYSNLKDLLLIFYKEYLGFSRKIKGDNERDLRALRVLGNLIVLFFRLPLLKRVTPKGELTVKDYFMYYLYAFRKFINEENIEQEIYFSKLDSKEKIDRFVPPRFSFIRGSVDQKMIDIFERSSKLVEEFVFKIPADSRPGYNISSLVIHQLATSAIAWSSMYYRLLSSNQLLSNQIKLECLRLAALLHDLGKPFNWRHHVSESAFRVSWLLSDIIEENLLNYVLDLVKKHHERGVQDAWISSIREGDHVASNFDRLRDLINSIINNIDYDSLNVSDPSKFRDLVNAWIMKNDWEAGDNLVKDFGLDIVIEFNSTVVKELRKASSIYIPSERVIDYLYLIKIDSRGIQRYIYSTSKIPELVFGSYLVDYIQSVELPLKLAIDAGLPLENILFGAGGNVYILAPVQYLDKIENIVNNTYNSGLYEKLGAILVYEKMRDNFIETLNNLERKATLAKIIDYRDRPIDFSLFQKCSSCQLSDADPEISNKEETLCVACYGRRTLGLTIHFGWKWSYDLNKWYNIKEEWKEISRYVLEFIAGHSIEETKLMAEKKYSGEYKSMAIIKIDGNAVGFYMSNSISLTHLIYKSYRIDIATKEAFQKFFKLLIEKGLLEDVWRIYLGILYIGGDDILVITPSYLALPLVWIGINEFVKNMGLDLTMSAGVIVAKPKVHLWSLFESVEGLLNRSKTASRKYIAVFRDGRVKNPGAVTFIFWKTTSISSSYVDHLIEVEKSRELRAATFCINPDNVEEPDLVNLISNILGEALFTEPSSLIEKIKTLNLKKEENNLREQLKKLRREILPVISEITSSKDIRNGLLYVLRNLGRFRNNEEKEELFRRILEFFRMHKEIYKHSVLLDALDGIDILLGGVRE